MTKFSLIHTADWHLGKMIREYQRSDEFTDALEQLYQHIAATEVDLLLIAGDIFDSAMPPAWAQQLYFGFLARLQQLAKVPKVIITAGNHDSALLLEAHKALFEQLCIQVVGGSHIASEEQLISLTNTEGDLQAIILAVPYLRDAQMRQVDVDGDLSQWKEQLHAAMHQHYAKLINQALELRNQQPVPIIAMGHLFMVGGKVHADDGMRASVGTLGEFRSDALFDEVDYLALGHLHQPQIVDKKEHFRYSGSLLKAAFSEIHQQKSVVKVDFSDGRFEHFELLPIRDKVLWYSLKGSLEQLEAQLLKLAEQKEACYVELCINHADLIGARSLQERYEGSAHQVKVIQLTRADKFESRVQLSLEQSQELKPLSELQPRDVFLARLEKEQSLDSQLQQILLELFDDITKSVQEES